MNGLNSNARCPTCGAELPAGAPQAMCPRCLLLGVAAPTETGDGTTAARPVPPSIESLRSAFPQLEILEFIGQGGMGCVFKARQTQLNRVVALKILPESLARTGGFAERSAREARALAALSHPNIVTVHDFGRAGEFYYLLMEYVDGVNLRQALRAGRFTPEQALAIVPPLCDALQYAHDRGIVHRDIKPENILLDRAGTVKVADFGIARMLAADDPPPPTAKTRGAGAQTEAEPRATGSAATGRTGKGAVGTPGYMAPEQVEPPHRADHRADIFSLGVVFYEMLTGEAPGDRFEPPSSHLSGIQIDVRLDEVVLRALEREPARRYQKVSELKTAVETVATPSGSTSPARAAVSQQGAVPPRIAEVKAAMRALKGPSIGMVVTGAITPLVLGLLLLTGVLSPDPWILLPFLFVLLASGLMIFGALRMRSLASRRQAMAGVIAGFTLAFVNLACLPFCVWAFTALSRDDVRGAFPDGLVSGSRPGGTPPVTQAILAGLVVGLSILASVTVFLALLPDRYSSVARIHVGHVSAEDDFRTLAHPAYDPYRLTTEFEKLRSSAVLHPVIEQLGLNQRWGKQLGRGAPLRTPETLEILRRQMDIRQARNTHLLEIRVSSEDGHEAAELVNAIAESYRRVRGAGSVEIVDMAESDPRAIRPNRKIGLFSGAALAVLLGLVTSGLTLVLATRHRPGLRVS
jgi:tRNA A-37 threonylcarbamoyl transferase component Bud32/capsular polysaccharide biosynthesis protein